MSQMAKVQRKTAARARMFRRREQGNAEEHEDGSGFAKDFEGEKALRKLAGHLSLHIKLS